jgi:DNA mismatch repair protein MutS2
LAEDWSLHRAEPSRAGEIVLPAARHPLVEACVANDLELDAEQRLLIVTGPNAGGKTVLLKTLGLAAAMAQSGLPVAAGEAGRQPRLPWFDSLLADIGDEQSIEASLSTYAGHLTNLARIVREADAGTLVLIDELGSGTDPDEGAALSQAILEEVLSSEARGLVTTHLAPLKVFASDTPGVRNAAMRFDVDALRPTFRLQIGQPGRSYALAIAERLGLGGSVLERAAEVLGPEGERLERLLATLERQREELAGRVAEADAAREVAVEEAETLRAEIERLREREDRLMAEAAARADAELQATLQRATRAERSARHEGGEARSQALEEIRRLREQARRTARPRTEPRSDEAARGPQVGGRVRVPSYDAEGQVVELRGRRALVQLGLLKVEVGLDEVEVLRDAGDGGGEGGGPGGGPRPAPAFAAGFDDELNVRGERVEQALDKIRDFVLEAHAMKVGRVRILHGKGTGALRDAVRDYLKRERRVERYEDAVPYEGGHGVTVAYLREGA